jgi:hypothetical protein
MYVYVLSLWIGWCVLNEKSVLHEMSTCCSLEEAECLICTMCKGRGGDCVLRKQVNVRIIFCQIAMNMAIEQAMKRWVWTSIQG